MAERADVTTGLGTSSSNPNLDGWEDPNTGWPNVNTTYLRKNMLKVTADGSVVVLGTGRRTITTANAWQKMIKQSEGSSTWNQFVRIYTPTLSMPLYSSIATGDWNHTTGVGGDNVQLMGVFKVADGVVAVGYHDGNGGEIPVTTVPTWGNSNYNGQSAVLLYLKTDNITNPLDGFSTLAVSSFNDLRDNIKVFPNPASNEVTITGNLTAINKITLFSIDGKKVYVNNIQTNQNIVTIDISKFQKGIYLINIENSTSRLIKKLVVK